MSKIEMYPVLAILTDGCPKLGLPSEAARELMRWLTIKRLIGPEEGRKLSPSKILDELQHWVLLNTEVRLAVELYLREIHHTTETESLDDVTKCKRRLASLHAMAFESWDPDLSLWVEPHTLMSGIKAVLFRSDDSDRTFNMYHTAEIGRSEIVSRNYRNESGGYYCDYCDEEGGDIGDRTAIAAPAVDGDLPPGVNFFIFVRHFTTNPMTLHFNHFPTILRLKRAIQRKLGLPPTQQRLIFSGKQLEDGKTVRDYNITNEATLHLCLRMRGC